MNHFVPEVRGIGRVFYECATLGAPHDAVIKYLLLKLKVVAHLRISAPAKAIGIVLPNDSGDPNQLKSLGTGISAPAELPRMSDRKFFLPLPDSATIENSRICLPAPHRRRSNRHRLGEIYHKRDSSMVIYSNALSHQSVKRN